MNASAVTVVITCTIRAHQLQSARLALAAVIQIVLAKEPGCHGIRVHEDSGNPQRLMIIEHWESKETFTGPHMQQPHMQSFLKQAEAFIEGAADFSFWTETSLP